ncbi:MAG: hypothetical protein HKL98_01255 [Burkholderiales bacterium]|nr:hypothetical protein [Burkholderiales bacterium]
MIYARWIRNQQGHLVCLWNVEGDIQSIADAGSEAEPGERRRGHLVLAWINPEIRRILETPRMVTNSKGETALLVSKGPKHYKMLKTGNGPLQLWTIPVEAVAACWQESSLSVEAGMALFAEHAKSMGVHPSAWQALQDLQRSMAAQSHRMAG